MWTVVVGAAMAVVGFFVGVVFSKLQYGDLLEAFLEMINCNDEDVRKMAREIAEKHKLISDED